jgi:hypothetical protein
MKGAEKAGAGKQNSIKAALVILHDAGWMKENEDSGWTCIREDKEKIARQIIEKNQ